MIHYVTFLWNPENIRAEHAVNRLARTLLESSGAWQSAFSVSGMLVLLDRQMSRPRPVHALPDNRGLIVGHVFSASGAQSSPLSSTLRANSVLELQAELAASCWGAYVAFLGCDEDRSRVVFRDCSGLVPCFRTCIDEVEIFFADLNDLLPLSPRFGLNLSYLAAFIYSTELQIRDCGIEGVTEVLAGECIEQSSGTKRQWALWDPCEVSQRGLIEDHDTAVRTLRRTVQACVATWASEYQHVLHNLSGGFDSAVVLGCLANAGSASKVTCLNYYSTHPGDDERRYARLAAKDAGVTLLEELRDRCDLVLDDRLLQVKKTPKPTVPFLFQDADLGPTAAIASQVNADSIWTGEGGDHLFLALPVALGAADYIRCHGLRPGFFSAVADAAKLAREPYMSVLRAAWDQRATSDLWRPSFVRERQPHFLNPEALPQQLQEYISHPWTLAFGHLPVGQQCKIFFLSEILNRNRLMPAYAQASPHHPLLSQPVIELCLQIPTYLLLRGGRQRALARSAFSKCVPAEILAREDKGDTTDFVIQAIRRSARFLCELLLDGQLVRARIVDRAALEAVLARRHPLREGQMFPLLACIAAEIWTRTCLRSERRAAA